MSLKNRQAIDQSLLPSRRKITNVFFGFLHLTVFILASTASGVRGASDDDGDYYRNSSNNDYDYDTEYDAEEEEQMHEMIVDYWYDLVRYLVGLGLCIFGLIGLYFHQFASYYFLKKYTRPRETERRIGRVVSCEQLMSSTSIRGKENRTKKESKKKKNKNHGVPVPTFSGEVVGGASTTTDYHREEDLELWQQQQQHVGFSHHDGDITDYRILVVYKVPKPRSKSLLCCNGSEEKMVINCTNSFAISACASEISDTEDNTYEAIHTYRSRSSPPLRNSNNAYKDLNAKISGSLDYMNRNSECEYFQWFETSTPKLVNSEIDLILLNGQPKSACTPEVLKLHMAQVGKAHEGREEDRLCKSISMLGMALAMAVIVLSLVCFFEIQAMPHPETQRPIGYMVLGGFFAGSNVSAYLVAKLLFEQYKQKVFLSAFTVPSTTTHKARRRYSSASEDTNIIDEETDHATTISNVW